MTANTATRRATYSAGQLLPLTHLKTHSCSF